MNERIGINQQLHPTTPSWYENVIKGWPLFRDYFMILVGSLIQALALRLFLIPGYLVSGGISGIAQIVEYYTHWHIGIMIFLGNLPLFIIGWRFLGGIRFSLRTATAVVAVAFFTDLLLGIIPTEGLTDDIVLAAVYGGLIYGIGLGLVYRAQGTSGGSDILCRILNSYTPISISQSYLVVDTLVVLAGGVAFGWDLALYGIVVIYISGLGAEMVSEGNRVLREAMIITTCPQEVAHGIMRQLERGVTILPGTGAYTGASRPVLYCVVTRSEINQLKAIIREIDPKVFMVIGHAYEAIGEGFHPFKLPSK